MAERPGLCARLQGMGTDCAIDTFSGTPFNYVEVGVGEFAPRASEERADSSESDGESASSDSSESDGESTSSDLEELFDYTPSQLMDALRSAMLRPLPAVS